MADGVQQDSVNLIMQEENLMKFRFIASFFAVVLGFMFLCLPAHAEPKKNKFDQEKEYEQKHKKRVEKIESDYDKKIKKKEQDNRDLQQQSSASGRGSRDAHQSKVDANNRDIEQLKKDKKQKKDDSRDTMKRQKDDLWNKK